MKQHPWVFYLMCIVRLLPILQSAAQGARNELWAATSPNMKSGSYYHSLGRESNGSERSRDEVLVQKLWEWTDQELELHTE